MKITFSRNEKLNFFSRILFIVTTIISILLVLFSLCDLKSVNLIGVGFYKINIFNFLILGIIGGIGAENSFFFKYRSYGFILIVVSFFLLFSGLLSLIVLGFDFISHKNLPAYNYNKLAPINFLFSLNIILFSAKNILEEIENE